jgi:hypothetical protein
VLVISAALRGLVACRIRPIETRQHSPREVP